MGQEEDILTREGIPTMLAPQPITNMCHSRAKKDYRLARYQPKSNITI